MRGSFLKVSSVLCSALLLSACSSTSGSSSREVERITDHYELMPVTQYDYEWDDNKSFAMNAMLSMGVQGNVYEAHNVEDTYTHYSGARRAGSAAIDFLGVNLGSAIADVANTGRANREAASVPPATGFFVPKSLIVDDAQQSFLNVRDYIANQVANAVLTDFDDLAFVGVYTSSIWPERIGFNVYFAGDACEKLVTRPIRPHLASFEYEGAEEVNWCSLYVQVNDVITSSNQLAESDDLVLVKTQLALSGYYLHQSIYRHADAISFVPHIYRERGRTLRRSFPYIAFKGKAHLFTRDSASVPINKPNL